MIVRRSALSEDEKTARRALARTYDKVIGRRLRQARMNARLTQSDLGQTLGLTFQSIQRYERGASPIGAGRIIEVAADVEAPVTYFFQDLVDPEGFVLTEGRESPGFAPLSKEAAKVARCFDAIRDSETQQYILRFIESLTAE